MFTKSLNCETCNFLAAKRPIYQLQGLFCFVFFILRPVSGVTKAIEKKKQNERAHCTHCTRCSIIVSSTYAVLELNIVKVQVHLIFVLQNFQL